MEVSKRELVQGIHLYTIPDQKFKNVKIGVYLSTPLRKETAAKTELLAKVLTAGCKPWPTKSAFHLHLESLFGASVRAFTEKTGEVQMLGIIGDVIGDSYAATPLSAQLTDVLTAVLLQPLTTDGAFDEAITAREKIAQKEDIEGVINDKRRFALMRCVESMCAAEPFGVRKSGTVQELDAITPTSLYAHYQSILRTAPIDIVIAGAFDVGQIEETMLGLAEKLGARSTAYPQTLQAPARAVPQYVRDHEPVMQGKLVIGYRTDIDPCSDAYYALMVYNGILGGGTSSKLFNTVREKMSLCYYASSAIERAKGLLLIQSGIEFANYQKTLDAIAAQTAAIRNGEVTETEFDGTVAGIINRLQSYRDTPAMLLGYYAAQTPLGNVADIHEAVEKISKVTLAQSIEIAQHMTPDTVYFLDGMKGVTAE